MLSFLTQGDGYISAYRKLPRSHKGESKLRTYHMSQVHIYDLSYQTISCF